MSDDLDGGGSFGGGDSYSETTRTSWFSRLGNAIKGIVVGLVLFLISFPLLFLNEGHAVTAYKSLVEGEGTLVSASADKVDPANDNKLVHISGLAHADEKLKDPAFGVEVEALRIQRKAEIYQWKQNEKTDTIRKTGGGEEKKTTYTYESVWADATINSDGFKIPEGHRNFGKIDFPSESRNASKVLVGAFVLSDSLVGQINNFEALPATADSLKKVSDSLGPDWQVSDGYYFYGKSPGAPAVGDQRVKFSVVKPETVSLFAQQTGDTFRPFQTNAGMPLERIEVGDHSAKEMFQHARDDNVKLTWILRGLGCFLMGLGVYLIFNPLVIFADVLPFLGTLTGYAVGFFAAVVAVSLSFITIGVAWVYYRPMIGIPLVVVGVGLLGFLIFRSRGGKKPIASA